MTTLAVSIGWGDIAAMIFAVAFAAGAAALVLVMLNLFRVVSSLKESVDAHTGATVPLIQDVDVTVKGVNHEIERIDSIMASAENVARNVESVSETIKIAVSHPIVKVLAFLAGARKASKAFREG